MIVGCGGIDKSSSTDFIPVEKSYVGNIQSHTEYIPDLDSEFVLLTDANARIYLHSFLHDLSTYEDSRVRVSGIYQPMQMASSSIDVLNVDSIDELDVVKKIEKVQTFRNYKFNDLGFDAKLPEDIDPKIIADSALFSFENTNFTISVKQIPSDFDSYLNTFSPFASDILKISDKLFYLYFISDFESLYVYELADKAVEIKVSKFESSLQSSADKVLENIQISISNPELFGIDIVSENNDGSPNDVITKENDTILESTPEQTKAPSDDSPQMLNFNQDNVISNNAQPATIATAKSDIASKLYVEQENFVTNEFKPIIAAFELSSNNLISDLDTVSRYYFAESKHFYVEYFDKNSQPKRVLIAYADNLKVIARFVEDEVMDWKLVSGENLIYDQNLTLVEKSGDVVSLKEGYRLFESLPLEFSLQYPMQMYYMRISDRYEFAADPNLKETTFAVERIENFDTESFYKLDTNLYFNGTDYIKVLPKFYVKISNFTLSQVELDYILSTIKFLSL